MVVMADINDSGARVADLGAEFLAVDVADEDSVASLVAEVVDGHGRLDVMVNNAGVLRTAKGIAADADADIRHMMEVNLYGVL